jgi:hypothetical protein
MPDPKVQPPASPRVGIAAAAPARPAPVATRPAPPLTPEVQRLLNPRRPFDTWWGIGSVCAGLLALAFLPVALLGGGGNWAVQVDVTAPIWATLCLISIACAIRGMRPPKKKRLRGAGRHWAWCLAGLVISLVTFVVLTIIAVIARW